MYSTLSPEAVKALRGSMSVERAAELAMVNPTCWYAWDRGKHSGKPLLMPDFRAELFRLRLAEAAQIT